MIMKILKSVKNYIQIRRDPIRFSRNIGVEVGYKCRFLSINPGTFGSEPFLISIGNHVTITSGVKFITHDGSVWVFREKQPDIELFGSIIVKDNVFIGINTTILPGVVIGENSIIGAGSIVTKNVPSDSVVAGIPAKRICSVDEYYHKNKENFSYVKSLSPKEKKKYLSQKLKNKESV